MMPASHFRGVLHFRRSFPEGGRAPLPTTHGNAPRKKLSGCRPRSLGRGCSAIRSDALRLALCLAATALLLAATVVKWIDRREGPFADESAAYPPAVLVDEPLGSVYTGTLGPPAFLDDATMTRQQESAFDAVEPMMISKKVLEAMTGRALGPVWNASDSNQLTHEGEWTLSRRKGRVIYFITPTYKRASQMVDMTRLMQTLQLAAYSQVGIVYWIVVEDSFEPSFRIRKLLERSGIPFAHIAMRSSAKLVHRGVAQRNRALELVHAVGAEGVIYFGDDDNAYDVTLFTELTKTKRVSIFNVAFSGGGAYERCKVDPNRGVVTIIYSNWVKERKFPMDMGGFAFSTAVHRERNAKFHDHWDRGQLETKFMEQLVDKVEDLEPLAANCTKILVWHVSNNRVNLEQVLNDNDYKNIWKSV